MTRMQAALKTPHLLMQEKHELIQIIDGLLHVRLCGECSHALSQQIKPVRGKLLKYREELMRYEAKMKRRAAGTPHRDTFPERERRWLSWLRGGTFTCVAPAPFHR